MNPGTDPETWLQRYGDDLYRYALMRLRDPAVAEDMVQETLLAALRARRRFAGQSTEKTWLIGILKHKIVDHFRRSRREQVQEDIEDTADRQEGLFDARGHWNTPIHAWERPAEALEQEELRRLLADCIAALPKRFADLYILREINGMPSEEVCKVLDISTTNNLWVMLSRARMRLRRCLERHWFDLPDEE